jgi:glucose dehydrogenase/sugar phosphate isomerase/epimerase
MKRLLIACLLLPLLSGAHAARAADYQLFARSNLMAWCIVPFDAKKRGPESRAAMMESLGFKHFAYDYRAEHIPTFDQEIAACRQHGVRLDAWWFPTVLNDEARLILDVLKRHNVPAQLWVTGSGSPTKSPEEQRARVAAEAKRIRPIAEAAAPLGCTVALYNHGAWFGEPENQIEIIQFLRQSGITNVGIVYNQHHGHDHLERFESLLNRMKPYLVALNLNGMTTQGDKHGKKILPLGQGDRDLELLRIIQKSGWTGLIGILNHTDEDAEARLKDNLDGLDWLLPQLEGRPPGPKPKPKSWREPSTAPPGPRKASGEASLSPDFGRALRGGFTTQGRAEFRQRPLTVECRVQLFSRSGFNILVASDPKSSADHWELYSYAGSGVLSLYQPGRGGEVRSSVNICDGQWHAVAAVIESDRVRLYVDGRIAVDTPTTPGKGKGTAHPGDFAIGTLVEGGIGCDGLIDDVRISRGVRPISSVSPLPLIRDAQTIDLWDFDALPAVPERAAIVIESAETRAALPAFKSIPAAKPDELTPASDWPQAASQTNWHRSFGDATSSRFSALAQIHRENVNRLEVAWTYRSKDGTGNIQCTPVIVGETLFTPTPGHHIVAIDAVTGTERWRFKPEIRPGPLRLEDHPARRGLLYWAGSLAHSNSPARLIFSCGNWIYALDPHTGKALAGFGENGRARIPTGGTVAGAIFRHVLVMPGFNRDVFGYDVATGRLLWTFHTLPRPGEYGHDTWSQVNDGANCWGGMALDEQRGIAYIATGSPKPNFVGVNHHGDNLFANCVIALDALSGKRLWHFQEIRHDIWDLDIPAPPNLVTVMHAGRRVDAVAQVTKLGNTLLLDRVSGQPLFPMQLRRAPASRLPGEVTAPYQPWMDLPEPFVRQTFTTNDITTRTEEAREYVAQRVAGANHGWFEPFAEGRPTILYGIHGGAEWTGAAFDPTTGHLFVSANEIPWMVTVFRDDPEPPQLAGGPTPGERLYQQNCAACHGADRIGIGTAPPLRGLRHRLQDADILNLLATGRNLMPPAPPMTDSEKKALLDFLFLRDRGVAPEASKRAKSVRAAAPAYTHNGYPKLLDQENYPGNRPPWGTLNCVDLNTGRLRWKVPLGEYPELTRQGIPKTGTENFGGASVTAGGLVFCSGTRDNRIRAFNTTTGAELWSHELPRHGTAPPATYLAKGRQFIVIPATGGGKLGGPTSDTWVAFALPPESLNRN